MLDVDEDEKLTGEEEFELLAGPLGLNDRRIVPEPVQFPDSDPLGASVAMVTATNSMEETLMQIGTFEMSFIQSRNTPPSVWFYRGSAGIVWVFPASRHGQVQTRVLNCPFILGESERGIWGIFIGRRFKALIYSWNCDCSPTDGFMDLSWAYWAAYWNAGSTCVFVAPSKGKERNRH